MISKKELKQQIESLQTEVTKSEKEVRAHNPFHLSMFGGDSYFTVTRSTLLGRLEYQEKMMSLLLAHFGLEYAKTATEENGRREEKEFLRPIKKATSPKRTKKRRLSKRS